MGRGWVRDRPLVVAGVVLIGVAVALAVWLYVLPSGQRDDVLKYVQFVLGLIGLVITVLGLLRDVRRPAEPRPFATLAELLAQAVHTQWRAAATERVLVTPAPIPVGWSQSNLPVAGPLGAAIGDPDVAPAFPPLPGYSRVTEEQLRAGGARGELFAVYAGIASGRVVVVGAPGAGKTGAAILLLLDALEHRDRVDEKDQVRVPVPVLLTTHGWDPTTCSVRDWLAARLVALYPLFQHRGGQAEAAALVGAGAVALILDGLDEMDVAWRPAALQALSDAPFRVVALTRSEEMVQAADVAWLAGSVAVQLRDVTGPQAADYLHGARTGPAPAGWPQLLTHLRRNPDSVLTRGLSTPLTLSLVRDTYRAGDDVGGLLDATRWRSSDDLAQHLIAGVLPDAYTRRPGRPELRYSLPQAKEALVFLAQQMNQDHTRDLAWWHIPRWAPTTPRILASVLASGLLGALLGSLAFVLGAVIVGGLWTLLRVRQGFLFGPTFGLGVGLSLGLWFGHGGREPKRVRTWRAIRLRSVLAAGIVYALGYVLAVVLVGLLVVGLGLMLALWFRVNFDTIPATTWGVMFVFGLGLAVGLTLGLNRDLLSEPDGEGRDSIQRSSRRNARVAGIAGGIVYGIAVMITATHPPNPVPLGVGLGTGLGAGLVVWLVVWLAVMALDRDLLGEPGGESGDSLQRSSRGNARVAGFVVWLVVASKYGPAAGLAAGFVVWLVVWLVDWRTLGRRNRNLAGGSGESADSLQRSVQNRRSARIAGRMVGIVAGITFGIVFLVAGHDPPDPVGPVGASVMGIILGIVLGTLSEHVVWFVFVLVGSLVPRVAGGFVAGLAVESAEGEGSPQEPLENWRNDRVFGLVTGLAFGLAFGLVVGLAFGLAFGFSSDAEGLGLGLVIMWGLVVGLLVGIVVGIVVGLVYGITSSETWSTTLAWLQLKRSRRVPAVGLMPFLEDARNRGVLRTVGGVYQFRHATLQDQLAGQTVASPTTSLAAEHTS